MSPRGAPVLREAWGALYLEDRAGAKGVNAGLIVPNLQVSTWADLLCRTVSFFRRESAAERKLGSRLSMVRLRRGRRPYNGARLVIGLLEVKPSRSVSCLTVSFHSVLWPQFMLPR